MFVNVLVCWDIPQPLPLIGFHGQPAEGLHATINSQAIAHQHIHDPLKQDIKKLNNVALIPCIWALRTS